MDISFEKSHFVMFFKPLCYAVDFCLFYVVLVAFLRCVGQRCHQPGDGAGAPLIK